MSSAKKKNINMKRLILLIVIILVILFTFINLIKAIINKITPEKIVGNENNSGFVSERGNVTYYYKYGDGIYKSKGNTDTKLVDGIAYSMTMDNDTLYYLTISEENTIDLMKYNVSSGDSGKVTTLQTTIAKFYIKDSYLYYVHDEDTTKIARLNLFSLEENVIKETVVQDFELYKNDIYYTDQDGKLYSIDMFGENETLIAEGYNIKNFQILKRWIYYYNQESKSLCKLKIDGKKQKTVTNLVNNDTYNITSKYIYYYEPSSSQIYRCKINGKKAVAIAKLTSTSTKINIAEDELYYLDASLSDESIFQTYRIKTNGDQTTSIDY